MAEQSIWKKEITLGRRKPAPLPAELTVPVSESVWKREIRLGKRTAPPEPAVERQDPEHWEPAKRAELWAPRLPEHREEPPLPAVVALPAIEPAATIAVPAIVALEPAPHTEPAPRDFAALDPKFRQVNVLAKLIEQRAAEYPARVDEWRQMLPRLAERAEDGVLPVELDGVVRTLFYELLHVGPNAPSKVEQPYRESKLPRLKRPARSPKPAKAAKPAEQEREQAATPAQSGLRREIHLSRPKLPKRVKPQPSETPAVQAEPAAAKASGLRRELHLPRPKLSRGPRSERPAKAE